MLQTMKQRYKNNNNRDFSTTCSSSTSSYKEEEEEEEEVKEEEEEEDELEVAEILIELYHLIPKYDTSPPLMAWGVKRKRSALDLEWNPSSSSSSPLLPLLNLAIPPPIIQSSMSSIIPFSFSSHQQQHHHPVSISVFVNKREEEQPNPNPNPNPNRMKKKKNKIESSSSRRSSPATPLSFSPSESDSIRKPYKRKQLLSTTNNNKKKTKEEWQTDVIMLADQQETLKKELRKVMDYYENLKSKNLELKLTLQKVKNHFHQKDLLANLNSFNGKGEGGLLHLCLEQPSSSPVPPPPPPQVQVIQKPLPIYQQQQAKIIEQQKKKCIRSIELLENSRYNSYNHQMMLPPPTSHLQFGEFGVGTAGFRGMDQNANPRGLPDLNFTDASSTAATTLAAADETTSSNGFEHPNPNYNYIQQQQQQQHWFESSLNNRAAAEARKRRMEEMRKGKKSMDSIKTRCR